MSTRSELGESPDLLGRLLGTAAEAVKVLARAAREREVEVVVIAARGTSDHAALYGQYVLGARNGLLVAPASPSLFSVYGTPPRMRHALVIGISQSGKSPDVVAVLDEARRQGSITAAITNDPGSELAAAADHVIELLAGPERAVAATKTYLAELAIIAMLSSALSGDDGSAAELRATPEALRRALGEEQAIVELAQRWASEPACAVLARGFHYATAREWALKLKELAHVLADPYSGADFQHGPITLAGAGFPVLAVVTSGPVRDGMAELLGRLRDRGVRLLVASDDPALLRLGDPIRLPPAPEWLSPLVAILPAQLFAYHLALARGLDTEAPPNLSKVTLTL